MKIFPQTIKQLNDFKSSVLPLYKLVDLLVDGSFKHFGEVVIIRTLLQNISFVSDAGDGGFPNLERDTSMVNMKLAEIAALCDYNCWYMTDYIMSELDIRVTSFIYSMEKAVEPLNYKSC